MIWREYYSSNEPSEVMLQGLFKMQLQTGITFPSKTFSKPKYIVEYMSYGLMTVLIILRIRNIASIF